MPLIRKVDEMTLLRLESASVVSELIGRFAIEKFLKFLCMIFHFAGTRSLDRPADSMNWKSTVFV